MVSICSQSLREAFYAVRRICIPVEEDIRRICEESGSVKSVQNLLAVYYTLDLGKMHFMLPKRQGYTPLTLAARSGHLALVRFLVEEERVPIDEWELKWHGSALHSASRKDHINIVQYLIKEGADVNLSTADSNSSTPLHIAASRGNVAIADCLIKNGALLESEDKNGSTPLHCASFHGHEKMIRLLLSNGSVKDKRNYAGVLPFDMYAARFKTKAVSLLLQVEKKNPFGKVSKELGLNVEEKEQSHRLVGSDFFAVSSHENKISHKNSSTCTNPTDSMKENETDRSESEVGEFL